MKYRCPCGNMTDNEEIIGRIVVHTCDECKKRILREVSWQSEGETYKEDAVICPFCEHRYDPFDCLDFEEGETTEHECEVCGRRFDVNVVVKRTYSTQRSVCEMPEDYEADW